jgi:protein ImuB
MGRVACLRVPGFPLAALLRAEPELRGRVLAVTERADPAAPLLAVSTEARGVGVRSGLTAAQARAIAAGLEIRVVSRERRADAAEALADVAASFSPRIEVGGEGLVHLDADGLETLCGEERHLATLLAARAKRVGLEVDVGIGSSRAVALLAARSGLGVVPAGRERELLAPLPLSLLEPGEALAARLERWGLRTLGELVRLPGDAVASRLGAAGLRLVRLARGEDERPIAPAPRPLAFEETVDCEWPIDTFEPLSFLLRAALERLVARIATRGFRAGDLELSLRLANRGRDARRITVAAPTDEAKILLALVRTSFETHPPAAAVESFRVAAVAERLRPIALDLFRPAGPLPEELATTLARLAAIAGADRLGRAVALDSHRAEAFALETLALAEPAPVEAAPVGVLALRAFRPPVALEVVCDRGRPGFVRSERGETATCGIQGRVVAAAGPWRTTGEWWGNAALARDDYDLELTDGGLYRVYREHASGRWFAAGAYD